MGFLSHLIADVNPFDGPKKQPQQQAAQLPVRGQPGFGVVAPQQQIQQQQRQVVQQNRIQGNSFGARAGNALLFNPVSNALAHAGDTVFNSKPANFAENFIGGAAQSLVRGGIAIPHDIGNAEVGIAHAFGKANNVHTQTGQQFINSSIGNNVNKAVGYTGTARQQGLDALNNAVWMLPGAGKAVGNLAERSGAQIAEHSAPVIGNTLSNAAGKVTTKLVNYGGHAQVGGTMMATQGAAQEALNNPHANVKTIATAAKNSYVPGLFLGAAAPVIRDVAPQVVPVAKAVDKEIRTANSNVGLAQQAKSEVISEQRRIQRLQQEQANTPIGSKASEQYQNAINQSHAKIQTIQANAPKLSLKDKVLAPNVGLTVGGPNALQYMHAQKMGKVFTGVDGKPRFEIDDSKATINPDGMANPYNMTLGGVLNHPELYKNYPHLKDTPIEYGDIGAANGQALDINGKPKIELNPNLNLSPDKLKSLLLHENQHSIQSHEGFALGDKPNGVHSADLPKLKQMQDNIQKVMQSGDGAKTAQLMDEYSKAVQESEFKKYHNNAAEAEARAVEARANLKPSERYVKSEPSYKSLAKDGIHKQPQLTNQQLESLSPEAIDGLKQQGFKGVSNGKRTVRFDDTSDYNNYYHGSTQKFDGFDFNKARSGVFGKAAYITNDKEVATYHGDVNNYRVPKDTKLYKSEDMATKVKDFEHIKKLYKDETGKELNIPDSRTFWSISDHNGSNEYTEQGKQAKQIWQDYLKKQGYDGVKEGDTVAIFNAAKLKTPREAIPKPKDATSLRSTFYDSLDVPKDQLIIRHDGGTAMSTATLTLRKQIKALATQAAKETNPAKKDALYQQIDKMIGTIGNADFEEALRRSGPMMSIEKPTDPLVALKKERATRVKQGHVYNLSHGDEPNLKRIDATFRKLRPDMVQEHGGIKGMAPNKATNDTGWDVTFDDGFVAKDVTIPVKLPNELPATSQKLLNAKKQLPTASSAIKPGDAVEQTFRRKAKGGTLVDLPLSKIDNKTNPIDATSVEKYKSAKNIPAIVVKRNYDGSHTIIDGFHRFDAASAAGDTHIRAVVTKEPGATASPATPKAAQPKPAARPQIPGSRGTGGESLGKGTPKVTIPEDAPSSGTRTRGLAQTIQDDPNTPQAVKDKVNEVYKIRNTKDLQSRAANLVKDDPALARRVFDSDSNSDVGTMIGSELSAHLSRTGQHEAAIEVAQRLAKEATHRGQANQALSTWGKLAPESVLRFAQKTVNEYNKKAGLTGTGRELRITPEQAKDLTKASSDLQKMAPGRAKDIATQQMLGKVKQLVPSSWVAKLSSTQTIAQLLNPKTLIRNILGNGILGGAENVSQTLAAGIDKGLSAVRGTPREVSLPNLKVQGKGFIKGGKEQVQELNKGVNLGPETQFDLKDVPTFRKGAMAKVEKTLGYALRVPDRAAFQAAYDDTVTGLMKANKLKAPTQEILDSAESEALYRTFQNNSKAAELFTGLKGVLNVVGKTGADGKKWGLGDLILKYPKTPGNILSVGFDYSPAGIMKGILEIAKPAITGKPFNQRAFSMAMARGTVGTSSLVGAGAALGALGIITEKPSQDPDTRNLQKTVGKGGYQINTSALRRFVTSGFSKDAAKLRPGDTLVSYDWAQPLSIPLSAGASLGQGKSAKDGAVSTLDNATQGINSLVEQPLVTGVNTFSNNIKNYGITGALAKAGEGAPASFVPTASNQVRQLTDNTTRNTYSNNDGQQVIQSVENRIPGLSKRVPAGVDPLGNDKQNYQNGSNNVFNVAFNPAFVNKYQPNGSAKLPLDILQNSGNTKQIPTTIKTTQNVNGTNIKLTPQQNQDLQRYVGKQTSQAIQQRQNDPAFMALSDNDKAKDIAARISDIQAAGRKQILGDNPSKTQAKAVDKVLSGNLSYTPPKAKSTIPPKPKDPHPMPKTIVTTYDAKTKTWTEKSTKTGRTTVISADGTRTLIDPGTRTTSSSGSSSGTRRTTGTKTASTKTSTKRIAPPTIGAIRAKRIKMTTPKFSAKMPKSPSFKTKRTSLPKFAYKTPKVTKKKAIA